MQFLMLLSVYCSYSGARTADAFLQYLEDKLEQDWSFAPSEAFRNA